MQVVRFEVKLPRPRDTRAEPRSDRDARVAAASPAATGDTPPRRDEDTPEEPGYGHGV